MLDKCAASLDNKIVGSGGKKLYIKEQLAKKIVSKIKSHLPQKCSDCKGNYTVELEATPLFSCFYCSSPSHDCDPLTELRVVWFKPLV